MAVIRGGRKRSYKQKGRKPIQKSYREAMRSRALDGKSHDASGNPTPNCSPTAQGAGAHLYFGYHLQRASKRK